MVKFLNKGNQFGVRRFCLIFFVAIVCTLLIFLFLPSYFVFNRSGSMRVGIYRKVSAAVTRGVIVGACIPESYATLARERGYLDSGSCKSGLRPVIKYVAAIPGDSVKILKTGVSVNGKMIPDTALLLTDSLGREIPNRLGIYLTPEGQ